MQEPPKEFQQKYMEYQLLSNQLRKVQEQLHKTDERIQEVDHVIESINDFSSTPKGAEVLIPVANGVFARAKVENASELLVNVGADTVVQKNVASAQEMLVSQRGNIIAFRSKLAQLVENMHAKVQELRSELERMQV